jgi:histone acetyltransferase
LGGCVFRPFRTQRFAEVVFLAITTSEQVSGLGTRLMNKLKDHAQKEGLQYFLTYADNNATGFFRKQGFNAEGYMPEARWKGYIKDYNGSTMMQCQIVNDVDYSNISQILQEQKETLIAKINSIINKRVYPGLKFESEDDSYEFEQIPGLKEAGWTEQAYEQVR